MTLSARRLFNRLLERRGERLAQRLAPYLPRGGRLLDIGSGTGHNAEALVRVVGGSCLQADVVDFHVGGEEPILFDGRVLPLADGAVDVCLLIHVLSYTDDPSAILREAARVANRRVIVVQTTYRGAFGRALLRGRGWIQGPAAFRLCRAIGLVPAVKNSMESRRVFTRSEVRAIAEEAGLRVDRLESETDAAMWISRDLLILSTGSRFQ